MAEQAGDDEPDIVIGPELQNVVKKNQRDFGRIAKNMERQLARLKKKLAKLKDENDKLRKNIDDTKKQKGILIDECKERNDDLKQSNENYSTKKNADAWDGLLSQVIERHQALKGDLAEVNYSTGFFGQSVDSMNKAWQNEIKKISQNAMDAANANDKDLIIEEMQARTIELETLQNVMNGNANVNELDDMLKDLQDRHAVQSGHDSSAKDDEKISDINALKDNQNWEGLMKKVVDDYKNGKDIKWLKEVNALYLMEMEDRISDLREIKDIFDTKYVQKAEQDVIDSKAQELVNNIIKRHKDTEGKAKNLLPSTDIPTKQMQFEKQLNQFRLGNENWRREINSVVNKLFAPE